jgi:hypothetical protein
MATPAKDKFSQKKMNPFTNSRMCINPVKPKRLGNVYRTALISPDFFVRNYRTPAVR